MSIHLPDKPTAGIFWPLPRIREAEYLLPVVLDPTPIAHGLNETTLATAGPLFPAACTTTMPAFLAKSRNMSNTFKNVRPSSGGTSGPMDSTITSTPSSAACKSM